MSDYSFNEISQIVESNDAKLLGAFVSSIENDIVQITLKINNTSFNEIIQTFKEVQLQYYLCSRRRQLSGESKRPFKLFE